MSCNRWQFQELHRLRQQLKKLTQEENDAKWTELVLVMKQKKEDPAYFGNKLESSDQMSKKKTKESKIKTKG